MEYTEKDLPLKLHHGEFLTLADGTVVRFESNGEAKDIMINDSWTPAITLFPANDFIIEAGGNKYKCTAAFEDVVDIVKL